MRGFGLCRGRGEGKHISLAAIFEGKHISLVICVRGHTYHGETHITVTPPVMGRTRPTALKNCNFLNHANISVVTRENEVPHSLLVVINGGSRAWYACDHIWSHGLAITLRYLTLGVSNRTKSNKKNSRTAIE